MTKTPNLCVRHAIFCCQTSCTNAKGVRFVTEQSKSQKVRAPLRCRAKTSVLTAEPSARQKSGPELDPLIWHQCSKNSTGQQCTVDSR